MISAKPRRDPFRAWNSSMSASLSALTPAQIESAYGFNAISFSNGTIKGNGAGQTIAIIDAYNDPYIYG